MTNAEEGSARLASIAEKLRSGEQVGTVTVRELLSWFGSQRRGTWVITNVSLALEAAQLRTDPEFDVAYIDTPIRFLLWSTPKDTAPLSPEAVSTHQSDQTLPPQSHEFVDPTHRIGQLAAANRPPVCVTPTDALTVATTLMLVRGFSQLPVVTGDRTVKGVISWASIGARVSQGVAGKTVQDMMDASHHEIRYDASLFQAIPTIIASDYVLVRGRDTKLTGIVTPSDLSERFQQLSEPFLLIGEIENHLRHIIKPNFELSDLQEVRDAIDTGRRVDDVFSLNFGEYVALLDHPVRWEKSKLPWDRKIFCEQLKAINILRNDVMHFNPDPLAESDLVVLREFARFLQRSIPPR